jgi:putative thiamine transport system ATP-binding protein
MLSLRDISLRFRKGPVLIEPFSTDVKPGEIITLMGRSGSGKSSILSYIGGDLADAFEASGEIILDDKRLNDVPAVNRRVARLFQDDLLFPHMTAAENLTFAIAQGTREDRLHVAIAALRSAGLEGYETRAPHTLSGGQRSRVALMRALLAKPKAILLDEPFSKLDADLRQQMREYTFDQISTRNIPAFMVTHDPDDAPKGGRILRIGKDGLVADV